MADKVKYDKMEKKSGGGSAGNTTKILIVGMITLVVIQVAVVIVLIVLGTRVGDLSSDVDEVMVEQSLLTGEGTTAPPKRCNTPALIFDDEFEEFNLTRWKHELTLGGGGNSEFQYYANNRSNSYVKDGVLYIKPTFLVDDIGEDNLRGGYNLDIWGSQPADFCTGPHFYGCFRTCKRCWWELSESYTISKDSYSGVFQL